MKSALRFTTPALAVLAAAAAYLAAPAPASACGGLVCDGGGPFNQVSVDQANERILFLMEDDGSGETLMTAVIQIQYEGEADDFAWILPVPEVPENVDTAEPTFFDELDTATNPTFNFPFTFAPLACSVFGCAASGGRAYSDDNWEDGTGGTPVNVWGTGTVGPYEMAVISSAEVDPLVEWIYRHGFNAPDEFIEIADEYVKDNYKFVVVRLVPDAGVNQLAPLVLQYHEAAPCVPLRLTSIAAVPDMGVRVYIVGPSRAVPLNFGVAAPDYTKLAVSPNGVADYEAFMASEIERSGGKAWVTEFAGPSANAISNPSTGLAVTTGDALEYLGRGAYVTRLYTKISPWEMDEDPFFQFDANGVDVDNLHSITITGTVGASIAGGGSGAWWNAGLAGDVALVALLVGLVGLRRLRRKDPPRQ